MSQINLPALHPLSVKSPSVTLSPRSLIHPPPFPPSPPVSPSFPSFPLFSIYPSVHLFSSPKRAPHHKDGGDNKNAGA